MHNTNQENDSPEESQHRNEDSEHQAEKEADSEDNSNQEIVQIIPWRNVSFLEVK